MRSTRTATPASPPGMDGFLTKPLDRERLATALATAAGKAMAA